MIRFFHEEKGSVLSLVAIGLIVILGMAALVLDGGVRYLTQSRLQTAADAAALAGAQLLPLYDEAETVAISIAGANGVSAHEIVVNVPYNDNQSRIEVICTRTLDYSFARVLGFNQGVISARCVAEKYSQWTGEALPFINTEDDYGTDPEAIIWVDTGPGDFGSLNKNEYEIIHADDPDRCYFQIDYLNGVELKEGVVATIKQEVGYVFDQLSATGRHAYLLSLNRDVINSGYVKLTDGSYVPLNNLKNNYVVALDQLVLLECAWESYDFKIKDARLELTKVRVWDIGHGEYPQDYLNPDEGASKMVE